MRKLFITFFAIALLGTTALAQSSTSPTLRIVTEDPDLPSELFFGNIRVKPVRLRPGTNTRITVDDSDFFVHQHYVDFLSRLPDPAGFAFWNSQITSCGADADCIDRMRVNTSASFFISEEFQKTGYVVYRAYLVAFGRQPLYREFMPDTRAIGQGVVVLQPGWPERLAANRQAFAEAFVQRAEFASEFPTSMDANAYADRLFARAGITPSAAERQAVLAAFGGGGVAGRARALLEVADANQQLYQREYNRAFVLMQYFGYLRRDPDAPGYAFWLEHLNVHRSYSNMVRAFIVAQEYRERF